MGGALNKAAEGLFSSLVKDYQDPSSKDKLSSIQSQVEDVKVTMGSNIQGMLRNLKTTENIEDDTKRLQDQARLFDRQAATLKRREQWKHWKLNMLIGGIILLVIIILGVSLAKSNN